MDWQLAPSWAIMPLRADSIIRRGEGEHSSRRLRATPPTAREASIAISTDRGLPPNTILPRVAFQTLALRAEIRPWRVRPSRAGNSARHPRWTIAASGAILERGKTRLITQSPSRAGYAYLSSFIRVIKPERTGHFRRRPARTILPSRAVSASFRAVDGCRCDRLPSA